ncbi:MAG: hypothetical protein WB586_16300 [Chthoniobacterales bacterium]
MKYVVRWSPKFEPGKQPGKDGIIECTEQLPWDRFAAMVAMGGLILIGMTIAILAISSARPKNRIARKPDTAQLNAPRMQQDAVDIGSKPANLDPLASSTSGYPSPLPTQGLVIKDPSGSPYEPPLTRKPALRRFVTKSDTREWRFQRHLSAVVQKPGYARDNKRKWAKAFIMYLEAHRDFLRKIQRPSEIASPNVRE